VKRVPLLLTALRAALAPVMMLLAFHFPSRVAFGLCLSVAFPSDVFDGMLARRLGIATAGLRRLDSLADSVFYVGAVVAAWHLHPSAITGRWAALMLLVALELSRYLLDFMKFRREASYHMWSSKLWGIALFAGLFSLLALDSDGVLADAAVYLGIAADLEGLAISLALRSWRSDVPTLVHALRLRADGQPSAGT